jgi:CLIP-associating protein 1/2
MAYAKPTDIDGFVILMVKSDVRIKPQLAEDLVNYLSDYDNSLECSDIGLLVDALIPWLTGSHFKVSLIINNKASSSSSSATSSFDKIAMEC